jgi:hypothetical protein
MTSAQFDQATAERLERITSNPNPRSSTGRIRGFVAWGKKHRLLIQSLDREAAIDSSRNVLAVIGGATILGDFGTMRVWLMLPMAAVFGLLWYADYIRHF